MDFVCPVCGAKMHAKGNGTKCETCGYVHIDSPVAEKIRKDAKKRLFLIIAVVIILWFLPLLFNF